MVKTTKRQQNDKTTTTNNKKPVVYTPYTSFKNYILSFLKSNEKRQYTLNELKQNYEVETNKKASLRSYQRYIKKLEIEGIINIKRQEQSYISLCCLSTVANDKQKTNLRVKTTKRQNKTTAKPMLRESDYVGSKKVHSAHSIRFSMAYEGKQPMQDIMDKNNKLIKPKIIPFGRIIKNKPRSKQIFYKFEDFTLKINTRRIQVFVHNPKGELTEEQMSNAKVSALKLILEFGKQTNISVEDKYLKMFSSHHVCEKKDINKAEKSLFNYCGEEIEKRTKTVHGDGSHPNKLEHKKQAMAEGYEWHYLELPKQFPTFTKNLEVYTRQITKHLEVMQQISDSVESSGKTNVEISRSLKKLTKLMKKQQEGN